MEFTTKAKHVWEDGQQWLHVVADNGEEWQEPISGWEEVHDICRGFGFYRNIRTGQVHKLG